MGYSCSLIANYVLTAIHAKIGHSDSSNRLLNGGFWQRGRENKDGSITGKVFAPHPNPTQSDLGYVIEVGSFKIDYTGAIKRFPGLSKKEHARIYEYAKELCTKERNESHTTYLFRHLENFAY